MQLVVCGAARARLSNKPPRPGTHECAAAATAAAAARAAAAYSDATIGAEVAGALSLCARSGRRVFDWVVFRLPRLEAAALRC